MSALSFFTIGVHTFRRLTSNCTIRAAGKRCHAQDDSNRRNPWLCLVGYAAWPIYDLLILVRALETRDVDTATRYVYFDAVRVSLTNQVAAAYLRRTRINVTPLAQSMAARALGIADPIVKKLISPESLFDLLGVGWPVTVVSDRPPGTVGITSSTIGAFGRFLKVRNMALIGSKCRRPPRCLSSNASVSRFDYCSGVGDWSPSPFQRILRNCSGMS